MDGTAATIRYPWEEPPATGAAVEVAEGLIWLRLPLPMALNHVNVYALDDGDAWTVIDTGVSSRKSREIWEGILAGPLAGKPVHRLILTHHHPDHLGLAGWFKTDHGAEVFASRTTWLFARMLTLDAQDRPTAEALEFWRGAGMSPEIFEKRRTERPFNFADLVDPIPLGFTRLQEGGTINMGGRIWDIRMGNGHSPEHATFWSRVGDLVISGDQVIASISPNLGVYPTEPMADPVSEWLEACGRLAGHALESHLVLPGHKLPFTGLPLRMAQLIENHHGALGRLEAYLDTPKTAHEVFQPLYMRGIGEGEYGLALVEAVAHLNHLYHQGRVARERREDGAWTFQRKG